MRKLFQKPKFSLFLPIPNKHTCVSDTPCATPISLNESVSKIKNLLNNLQISFSFNNINNRLCERERMGILILYQSASKRAMFNQRMKHSRPNCLCNALTKKVLNSSKIVINIQNPCDEKNKNSKEKVHEIHGSKWGTQMCSKKNITLMLHTMRMKRAKKMWTERGTRECVNF